MIPNRDDVPEDPYVPVDYDDARDPETGAIHPTVQEYLDRADWYADVPTSGSGVHTICRSELPEDVKAINATTGLRKTSPSRPICGCGGEMSPAISP